MSRQLRLEDLKWEGTNSRRFLFPRTVKHTEMKFMEPVIDFDEFQFTLKIHSIENVYKGSFRIGVCDKNHPKKKSCQNCYFGISGGIGWGWNKGYGVVGGNGFSQNLKETFGNSDLVTVSVNRSEKWIEFLKNKKSMGKIENLEFPKDLVIAVSLYFKCDIEVIEFSCKPKGPSPPTKEEMLIKELEKTREETKLLKITCDSQKRQIEENRKKNEELRMLYEAFRDSQELQIEELRKKLEGLAGLGVKYKNHFEMYHRTKYSLKSSITPQMFKKRDQVNYCFANDTFHFRFDFSIQSGPRADEQNSSIDFEGLKLFVNGEPFSRIKFSDNSIEFEETFTKIGRNELTCLFQNIKKTFLIDVEPVSLCNDRCDLLFYRADLEPTGAFTKSSQPTEKFSTEDTIQIILKLVNENGVALHPKFLVEEILDVKMIKTDGKKKKVMKKILSREHDVSIDQVDSKGEFCVCSIEEKKLERGTYEVNVYGVEIGVKKVFSIE